MQTTLTPAFHAPPERIHHPFYFITSPVWQKKDTHGIIGKRLGNSLKQNLFACTRQKFMIPILNALPHFISKLSKNLSLLTSNNARQSQVCLLGLPSCTSKTSTNCSFSSKGTFLLKVIVDFWKLIDWPEAFS